MPRLDRVANIEELRGMARRSVPGVVFDFVDGAAEDERTARANVEAFERWWFAPRTLVDVSARDCSTTLGPSPAAFPAAVGPTGGAGLLARHGDLLLARAAKAAGLPFVLSTVSMYPLERLAEEVGGELWFQLYNFRHRSITDRLVERAREAGYRALVVTTDCAVVGKRERDLRHGMLRHQLHLGSRLAVAFYPRWALTVLTSRPEFVNLAPELPPGRAAAPYISSEMDPSFDWDDLQRLRQAWPGAMFLKGVLRADDAARAVSFGLDGIVLSNHGGRQLECAIPALEVLSEVVDAVGAHATVLVDGGVRRGGDIAKAVALGASGVLLGRAPLYGLAAAGEAGVAKALEILRDEFDRTLALNGCTSVAGLTRELLRSR